MTLTSVVSLRFSLFKCSTSSSKQATFSSCRDTFDVKLITVFFNNAKSVVKASKDEGDRWIEEVANYYY
jgi:hypothetical protein